MSRYILCLFLLSIVVPLYSQPVIFDFKPEDTMLTALPGDTLYFMVSAGIWCEYLWTLDDDAISFDTTAALIIDEIGGYEVTCQISNEEGMVSITWHVTVTAMYIAAIIPDSTDITIRRSRSVDFSVHIRTVLEDEINIAWTYIDRRRQRHEIGFGDVDSVTFRFTDCGDCWMEAAVWTGENDDWVTWTIHVRSLIWWWWPSDLTISVPVDTTLGFAVLPFVTEDDTVTFEWILDGEAMGLDSTVSEIYINFDELGDHSVSCAVFVTADTTDSDTVTWQIDVYDPADVSPPVDATLPESVNLYPPSPNPFNAKATIRYDIPFSGYVRLEVYDLSGRQVDVLVDGEMTAGSHGVELDASGMAAGVYFVVLRPPLSPPLLRRGGDHSSRRIQKVVVVK